MKVLITGGSGFIGSHLAQRFCSDGASVTVLDNLSSGRLENLSGCAAGLNFVKGDLRDAELVRRLCGGCKLVLHQAAVVSVPYSVQHPSETHQVNLQGTLDLLLAARDQGVRRLVFASSAAVYGEDPRLPKTEEMLPCPVSPYGAEKLACEHYLSVFNKLYGLETVSLRYFNVFGPRQAPGSPYSGVISIFADRLGRGQAPVIFGDGQQTRDFIYVDDVVQANLLAASSPSAPGRVYNIGCGHRTSLNDLWRHLTAASGHTVAPQHQEARPGDIRHSQADIGRARGELGFEPVVTVEQGLRTLLATAG